MFAGFLSAALLSTAVGHQPLYAVEWIGEGATDAWTDPDNWEFGMVPGAGDTATITDGFSATLTGLPPTVQTVQIGIGTTDGYLTLNPGINGDARLNATEIVLIASAGSLQLNPGNAELFTEDISNLGTVALSTGTFLQTDDYAQSGTGSSTTLGGGKIEAINFDLFDGLLTGPGMVEGTVTLGAVGNPSSSPTMELGLAGNTLLVQGGLNAEPNAEIVASIDTSGPMPTASQLVVGGSANLGGTLNVDISGGGSIARSQQVEVVLADSFTFGSSFDDIVISSDNDDAVVATMLPAGVGGLTASVRFHHSDLLGDMFDDGVVDEKDARFFAWAIRDALTYRTTFFNTGFTGPCDANSYGECGVAEPKQADIDGDTELTFADIPAFLDLVNDSGGSVAAAQSEIIRVFNIVPEPSGQLLALGLLGCFASLQRQRINL